MAARIRYIDDVEHRDSDKLIGDLAYAFNDGPVARMVRVEDTLIRPWPEYDIEKTTVV